MFRHHFFANRRALLLVVAAFHVERHFFILFPAPIDIIRRDIAGQIEREHWLDEAALAAQDIEHRRAESALDLRIERPVPLC